MGQRFRARGFHEKMREDRLKPRTLQLLSSANDLAARNLSQIKQQLGEADATYLQGLCDAIVTNYTSTSGDLTVQAREEIAALLRFTILGKTKRCRTETPECAAFELCEKYSREDAERIVTVTDMTSKTYDGRVVAQNALCLETVGVLTQDLQFKMVKPLDILCVLMAILGAYFQPGVEFCVLNQELSHGVGESGDMESRFFEMTYVVDVDSFLLILYGTELI